MPEILWTAVLRLQSACRYGEEKGEIETKTCEMGAVEEPVHP